MREDGFTTTEAAAADHARILGAAEAIGGGAEVAEWRPLCSKCQRGVKGFVCGPCRGPVSWWCIRCDSPQWSGSPEEGCPDCGMHVEVD